MKRIARCFIYLLIGFIVSLYLLERAFEPFDLTFLRDSIDEFNDYKLGCDNSTSNQEAYMIFSCPFNCGGWADRLKGIFSAYALALVLNRTFIIEQQPPCPLEAIIEPNLVTWNKPINPCKDDLFVYKIGYENATYMENFEFVNVFNLTEKKYFKIISTSMYANSFAKNKHIESRLREIGYEPSRFLVPLQTYRWYDELFKLPHNLTFKYEDFLSQAKPNSNSKLICAQVRIGQKSGTGRKDEFFMNRNETILYWNLIKKEFVQKLYSNQTYKIFVTSDQDDVKEEARQVFGDEYVISTENSSFHFERDFKKATDQQCQLLENVLFDFHVMQHCDAAVVSHSGFGILALMNRPKPYENLYVYSLEDQDELAKHIWSRSGRKFKFHKINNIMEDIYFL